MKNIEIPMECKEIQEPFWPALRDTLVCYDAVACTTLAIEATYCYLCFTISIIEHKSLKAFADLVST